MEVAGIVLFILIVLSAFMLIRLTIAILKWMVTNAIIGLALLGILSYLGIANIPLNITNLLIVSLGGVIGVLVLLIIYG